MGDINYIKMKVFQQLIALRSAIHPQNIRAVPFGPLRLLSTHAKKEIKLPFASP
jgi:hypothetical protein